MKRAPDGSPTGLPVAQRPRGDYDDDDDAKFARDKQSLREQIYETGTESLKKAISQIDINTSEDADRVALLVADFYARNRQYVDLLYPARTYGGDVVATGGDDSKALGLSDDIDDDTDPDGYLPTLIPRKNLPAQGVIVQIACGGVHSVALTYDGHVYTWGSNDSSALGRGEVAEDEIHLIKRVPNVCSIVQIDAGDNHTIIIDSLGRVFTSGCYKTSEHGLFRDMSDFSSYAVKAKGKEKMEMSVQIANKYFEEVTSLNGRAVKIVAGWNCNAALMEDGQLYTCT
jgi:alpha-tubulin suppressor-like RCC1 family protein